MTGWESMTLGEVIQLDYGKPLAPSERNSSGLYPAYGANGEKDRTDKFYRDQPSIIVGRKGSAGEITLTEEKYWPLDVTYFAEFDRQRHDLRFLYYLLTRQNLPSLAKGVKPGINRNEVYALPVMVPPLAEQQCIVAILDEAFEGIATAKANAEKSLQNAHDLFAGHLHSVFAKSDNGWTAKTVQQWVTDGVLAKPQDGNHGEIHPTKADYVDRGVPFIMAADLIDGEVDTQGCRFIAEALAQTLRIGFAKPGDVLLSHKGTIGRVAMLESSDDYVVLTPQVTYYRSLDSSRLFNGFLYYCLLSPAFQLAMGKIAGAGSTRAYIGITRQLDLQIALPLIEVQRELAARLGAIQAETERLAAIYEQKLLALDELKKSLLHQAFTGQLTSSRTVSIAQPATLQTAAPEFAANVIALAYARHERQKREKAFGRVKEQKTLHLVEAVARIDLGRQPMRDAAGPNDFRHMLRAEEWAKANHFFEMVPLDGRYEFRKLYAFEARLSEARQALAPYLPQLESVIDLLVPMDKVDAEVFVTVLAAWNNLLIEGVAVTDDAIVLAARDDWHADKHAIAEHRFRSAIDLIRRKGLVPDGTAKYVGGQQPLR
ncbi:MAG: restriction endonuclease subunit S [Burkholderiaceae bacterium]|nr:restriction endonuclease subunit S [Burkholderiaceae bacterium]